MLNYPQTEKQYLLLTTQLKTILDFYRFGLSAQAVKNIYLGHGTDDMEVEIASLILGSLNLPLDCPETYWQARLSMMEREHLLIQFYKRFEQKIPVPYLIHQAYFCGLKFYVDERVLIPRSPIAELIESQFTPWVEPEEVTSILDLCTGSGCIAAACAYAFSHAEVDAIDIDTRALEVAQQNIQSLGLEQQVRLIQSDGLQALSHETYDIIVSNPPYVSSSEMQGLPTEYEHEPQHALEAKDEGLALVHHILANARKHLKPNGILVVEVGNSDEALIEAYPELPFIWLEFERGGHGVFLLHAQDLP
jgi:ribosomal protein L3 glutamine methyltransferase